MILENSREHSPKITSCIGWSEILNDVRRECGKTFETVSKQMTLTYPRSSLSNWYLSISSDNSFESYVQNK